MKQAKKIVLLFSLLISAGATAQNEELATPASRLQRTQHATHEQMTERMISELQLNAKQAKKVTKLNSKFKTLIEGLQVERPQAQHPPMGQNQRPNMNGDRPGRAGRMSGRMGGSGFGGGMPRGGMGGPDGGMPGEEHGRMPKDEILLRCEHIKRAGDKQSYGVQTLFPSEVDIQVLLPGLLEYIRYALALQTLDSHRAILLVAGEQHHVTNAFVQFVDVVHQHLHLSRNRSLCYFHH